MKKMNRKISLYLPILSVVLLGIAILFAVSLKSQDIKVNLKENVVDNEESPPIEAAELPGNFPVYQNSVLVTNAISEDGRGISFIWETDDDVDLVCEYLKSDLRIKGWTLSNESSIGGSLAVSFEKDNIQGFLGVFKGGGGKGIISVTIKKP